MMLIYISFSLTIKTNRENGKIFFGLTFLVVLIKSNKFGFWLKPKKICNKYDILPKANNFNSFFYSFVFAFTVQVRKSLYPKNIKF